MHKKIINVLYGMDIEFLLKSKEGKNITAEGWIKGTKENPYKFDANNKFFATSLDCTSAEVNIPPANNPYDIWNSIEHCKNYIKTLIPDDLQVEAAANAWYEEDQLKSKAARTFGCSHSLCCYDNEEHRPIPSGDNNRAFGSHWHISYDNADEETNKNIVRALDLFLSVPAIIIEPKNERKSVGYGEAGNYRNGASYSGLEYRSLSGFFSSEQRLIDWIFRNSNKAIDFVNSGDIKKIIPMGRMIQNTINKENKEEAEMLINEFKLELV